MNQRTIDNISNMVFDMASSQIRNESEPEVKLVCAIISEAVFERIIIPWTETGRESMEWIGSTDFEYYCDSIGVDESYLRSEIEKWARIYENRGI